MVSISSKGYKCKVCMKMMHNMSRQTKFRTKKACARHLLHFEHILNVKGKFPEMALRKFSTLLYRSLVVFLEHRHPGIGNFNSIIPVYVDSTGVLEDLIKSSCNKSKHHDLYLK